MTDQTNALPAWVTDNLDAILAFELLPSPARGCMVPGCRRDAFRLSLCRTHYNRARDTFGPVPPSRATVARRAESAGVVPTDDSAPSPAPNTNNTPEEAQQ